MGIRTFMVVRHPLDRFLSGYGTVITRMQQLNGRKPCVTDRLAAILNMSEPQRLSAYLELYLAEGERWCEQVTCRGRRAGHSCLPQHVLSQRWFRNLWPGPIDFMLHTETLTADIQRLSRWLGVALSAQHSNAKPEIRAKDP